MKQLLNRLKYIKIPRIGLRNIKTALAVLICLIGFRFVDSNRSPVYACIAAIISMQNTMENSISIGLSRFLGTVIGSTIGILFILTKYLYYNMWLHFFFIAIGIIIVIYLNVFIKRRDSVAISCVVFLIIMINSENFGEQTAHASLIYAVDRTVDTVIGVIVALLVNIAVRRRKYVAKEIAPESSDELEEDSSPRSE